MNVEETVAVQTDVAAQPSTSPRARRVSSKSKKTALIHENEPAENATEVVETETTTPKKRRRTKNIEPVVYDIPLVEHKTTSFRGMHTPLTDLANNGCVVCLK